MKVGFITMEKHENRPLNSVGSARIRARWLTKYWDEAEEFMTGKPYDVMVFQKAYWREMMINFKGIKIFDLCDPDWIEPRPVVEVMEFCDAMVTSTPALAEYISKFVKGKPVICIPDRVDLAEHTPRGKHEGKIKKAIWFGYSANIQYVERTFDDLIDKDIELVICSNSPYNARIGYDRLKITNVMYDYKSVHEHIKECDIALLPNATGYRGKFKSNNKVLTAWALGVPVAQFPEDLDTFMEADARDREQELRLKEIKEKWDVKLSVAEYQALIKELEQSRGAVGERSDEAKKAKTG